MTGFTAKNCNANTRKSRLSARCLKCGKPIPTMIMPTFLNYAPSSDPPKISWPQCPYDHRPRAPQYRHIVRHNFLTHDSQMRLPTEQAAFFQCLQCGKKNLLSRKWKKFCCDKCRLQYWNRSHQRITVARIDASIAATGSSAGTT